MAAPVSASTLSTYTASDGENIAVQDWPLPDGLVLRGMVIVLHGLGEHAGRHDALARRLNGWGFAVRGYDQYGHGESGGGRGLLPTRSRLLDDLADIIDSTRLRMPRGAPLIVIGHSLGGLVAGHFVSQAIRPVEGLVMLSPALDPRLSLVQRILLAIVPRVLPNLVVSSGVDPAFLSHDPQEVAAYRRDPLVHDRVSGRLGHYIAGAAASTVAAASAWQTPTLLLYAGADRIVNPAGSRAFAAAAPKDVVSTMGFDGLYHELLTEADPEPVYRVLKRWLDARFAGPAKRARTPRPSGAAGSHSSAGSSPVW